ncbi:MAG: hypothetical protein ACOX9R_08755 [Armatimonadota bacterium]|jgi:hypothetical protein
MHRVMSLATVVMNAAGVCVVTMFGVALGMAPAMAARSGSVYAGVLLLATFASERIRTHVLVDDTDHSPPCCTRAMTVSRGLLVLAWVVAIALLGYVGIRQAT